MASRRVSYPIFSIELWDAYFQLESHSFLNNRISLNLSIYIIAVIAFCAEFALLKLTKPKHLLKLVCLSTKTFADKIGP